MKGPSVPALSSMVLPGLLDAIDHLQLGMSTLSDEDQSSEEQPAATCGKRGAKVLQSQGCLPEICKHP